MLHAVFPTGKRILESLRGLWLQSISSFPVVINDSKQRCSGNHDTLETGSGGVGVWFTLKFPTKVKYKWQELADGDRRENKGLDLTREDGTDYLSIPTF